MDCLTGRAFAHRENKDGMLDSICTKRFATVATSMWEPDLETGEREHTCDPATAKHFERQHRATPVKAPRDNRPTPQKQRAVLTPSP